MATVVKMTKRKKVSTPSNVEGAVSNFKNSFAPGTVTPAAEAPYIEQAPAGYRELAGSYGFDVSPNSDFNIQSFITWVKQTSGPLDTWLTNVSGGAWHNGNMGSLANNAGLGSPKYPFQVKPPASLSASQQTYNNNIINEQYTIYTSKLPNVSSATIRNFLGATTEKAAIIGNSFAAMNVVAYQVFNSAGFSLNPADGFIDGLASAYVNAVSPDAYASLIAEVTTLAQQEVAAANAASKQTLNGLFKFAGTAIAILATAGLATPALAATLKNTGTVATALSNNPAITGSTKTTLAETGQALNPGLLTQLQTYVSTNPNAGLFITIGVIILVIIIVIVILKSK